MKPLISYKQLPQQQIKKLKLITYRDNLSNTWQAKGTCSPITCINSQLSLHSHPHMPKSFQNAMKPSQKLIQISSLQKRGLSQRFQNRWDSPRKRWDRVKIPILAFFFPSASNRCAMNVGIGLLDLSQRFSKVLRKAYALYQRFQKHWYRPFKLY